MDPLTWIGEHLDQLRQQELLRQLPAPIAKMAPVVEIDGRQVVNFASNDYLNLAADQRLIDAALEAIVQQGLGRGASPLICGRSLAHDQLERRLAEFEQTEAALLFPSGFAANAGIIPALVERGDAIFGDAKNHASIIDGCRLSRAEKHVYAHGDIDDLERCLQGSEKYRRRLIVTDTLFSMDGDLAPLPQIGELAEKYDAMLMVDEAHATGVFGRTGRGVVEHFLEQAPALERQVSVRVGTLSKAIGAAGGFVCGSKPLIEWLANRARSYVFSTAQPASIAAAALCALEIATDSSSTRETLLSRAEDFRSQLHHDGWDTGCSASQIIPIRVGPADRTMQLAAALRKQGYWVPGIRPPSVPEGESLLRLSLTAAHTPETLSGFLKVLRKAAD